ncbi:MAG: sulfotransferase [Pseudomonadota bacterium]
MSQQDFSTHIKQLDQYLLSGQNEAAAILCGEITAMQPQSVSLLLMLSQVWQRLGNFAAMLASASSAVKLQPDHKAALLREIESQIYCGQIEQALRKLAELEQIASHDAHLLQEAAQMYLHCAAHEQAGRCYERAVLLQPEHAPYVFNLASSCVALGEIKRAEELFNLVIQLDPGDLGAYLNRSMLKTWRPETQHIAELSQKLDQLPVANAGEVPLCFALAKEYEDLGEAKKSFAYLQRGANRRRSMLAYSVEQDVAAMARIQQVFTAEVLAKAPPPVASEPSFFILGLPRSGTTLVDRILSSHSKVSSLGEINYFAYGLMQLAAGSGGKLEMIQRSAQIDMAKLGQIYRAGITAYGNPAAHLINKTPQNYLYLGLIRMALPGAKIIHLRRHPLDSCYAMYKTLFRMGYPFSYSLDDLGQYYLAYHRLMQHWREVMPGQFLDLDYETLVDQQENTTRTMLEFCALEWEEGCLDFHKNTSPAATASAAQVRQPVYRSSLQRWREYAEELAPLTDFLTQHGVDCS